MRNIYCCFASDNIVYRKTTSILIISNTKDLYTKTQKKVEIYTLFPDEHNEKRQLRLDAAFVMLGSRDILKVVPLMVCGDQRHWGIVDMEEKD